MIEIGTEVEYQGPKVGWTGARGLVTIKGTVTRQAFVEWFAGEEPPRPINGWYKSVDLKVVETPAEAQKRASRAIYSYNQGDRIRYAHNPAYADNPLPGYVQEVQDRDGSRELILQLDDGSQVHYSTERDDTPGLERERGFYPGELVGRWRKLAGCGGSRIWKLAADELEAALNELDRASRKLESSMELAQMPLTAEQHQVVQDAHEANREI